MRRRLEHQPPRTTGRQIHRLLERHFTEGAPKGPADGSRAVIGESHLETNVGARGVGQGQCEVQVGSFERHRTRDGQAYVVPEPDIAAANGGHPIPPDRGMVGGAVGSDGATIVAGMLQRGLLRAAGRGRPLDPDGQRIRRLGAKMVGNVETTTLKGSFDASQRSSVEEDLGLPVDTVELEKGALGRDEPGRYEFVSIPEIGVEERVGDGQLMIAEVQVGERTDVVIAGQHRSRHRRHDPLFILESHLRDRLSVARHERGPLQSPAPTGEMVAMVVGDRGPGVRLRDHSPFADHLELAQHISVLRGRAPHQDTQMPGLGEG